MRGDIFGVHAKALMLRAERAGVLATNLANADTPGYKARDFDFNQVLSDKMNNKTQILATHRAHFSNDAGSGERASLRYRMVSQPSLDGNTVDIHKERAEFMQNSLMYQASLRFLNGRINGLRNAIRGE